jgi:predicted AAA+ superfamily ATPase
VVFAAGVASESGKKCVNISFLNTFYFVSIYSSAFENFVYLLKYSVMNENIAKISKYNFWSDDPLNLGFERSGYLDKVIRFTGNKLVKVLVGQRRSGKSYLLRQIMFQLIKSGVQPQNTFYINKEYVDFDFLSDYKELALLVEAYKNEIKPVGKIFLFLDEIQNIEGWERLVNSYSQDFVDTYELFISGSNSQMLAGELATLLSGRYVSFHIHPFSFSEFCLYKKIELSKTSYLEYLQTGALPELFHLPDQETKSHYVSAIKDTVLLRDVIQRYNIKDTRLLEDVFIYLVNNASNLVSVTSLVNYFKSKKRKTNYETISNYIQYISNTFLIHKVERYNIKGKEIISGNCKFYINDLAFKNYLYSGFGYGIGYLLENAVYLQLRQMDYEVSIGTMRNAEIDFVAKKGDRTIYIQVAYLLANEVTVKREYDAFKTINDNYEKYVVSFDDIQLPSIEGIKHLQVWRLNEVL